jgi:hypothetical protein
MLQVSRPRMTIYEYVVEEDEDKTPKEWFEDVVHESLEGGGGVGKTKRHDEKLVMAFMGPEGCLWNVIQMHPDLVVTSS